MEHEGQEPEETSYSLRQITCWRDRVELSERGRAWQSQPGRLRDTRAEGGLLSLAAGSGVDGVEPAPVGLRHGPARPAPSLSPQHAAEQPVAERAGPRWGQPAAARRQHRTAGGGWGERALSLQGVQSMPPCQLDLRLARTGRCLNHNINNNLRMRCASPGQLARVTGCRSLLHPSSCCLQ